MEHEKRLSYGQLGVGLFLLVAGAVLLMNNLDIIDTASVWNFWTVIIIMIGIGKLVEARATNEYHKGIWFLFLGAWFLISELHLFGFSYHNSWPILLIGIGIGMLWKSFYPPQKTSETQNNG